MPTSYPGSADSFTNKVDGTSDVLAADINNLQDAVAAIQTRLGLSSSGANITAGSASFTASPTVRNGSPTVYLRDTDHMSAMLHCNANVFYILRGGVDSDTWSQVNSQWPLQVDLSNNDATFGRNLAAVGNVTAYSDERLKTNWQPLAPDFLTRFSRVKTGVYDRIDNGVTQVGVSAQSLREVLPQAVLEDDKGTLSVAYGNAALAACVELAKRVVEQEERIARLEALVAKLVED